MSTVEMREELDQRHRRFLGTKAGTKKGDAKGGRGVSPQAEQTFTK